LAPGGIGNGIRHVGGAARLVVDSSNIESFAALEERWTPVSMKRNRRMCQGCIPLPWTVIGVTSLFATPANAEPASAASVATVAADVFIVEME
jgi:hypothetical protein